MERLDTYIKDMPHPVGQIMDWPKEDQDLAIVECILDLHASDELFDIYQEAYQDFSDELSGGIMEGDLDEIEVAKSEGRKPEIDYEVLYLPLEHIINDRIDMANES